MGILNVARCLLHLQAYYGFFRNRDATLERRRWVVHPEMDIPATAKMLALVLGPPVRGMHLVPSYIFIVPEILAKVPKGF